MRCYSVYVSGWGADSHQGSSKQLKEAREIALGYLSQTRNVQIFLEWEIKLPFGWILSRTKKLTNWHTGETI